MARPRKTGLDYFPFDVDFFSDEKVVCIGGEFGVKGELTIIRLLCAIYRNGYFTLWNESLKYKLKREMDGVSGELLERIVQGLVRRGFFDESLFNSDSVLTSEGIQRRYFEATRSRQQDQPLPYLLRFQRGNHTSGGVSNKETPVSNKETPQSKVKKIKISSDEDRKRTPSPPPFVEDKFLNEFFCEKISGEADRKRMAALESLRRRLGFASMEEMRRMAGEIIEDWRVRRHVPADWNDASSHLISTLRKRRADSTAAPRPAPPSRRDPQAMANEDMERQREERAEAWERQKAAAMRPADYIRGMGYDPEKVTMAMVMNPEWRARNPPAPPCAENDA